MKQKVEIQIQQTQQTGIEKPLSLEETFLNILKSENPFESLDLAEIEDKLPAGFYEEAKLGIEQIVDLVGFGDKVEMLKVLKNEGQISENVFDVFAHALLELFPEKEKSSQPEVSKPASEEEVNSQISTPIEKAPTDEPKEPEEPKVSFKDLINEARRIQSQFGEVVPPEKKSEYDRDVATLQARVAALPYERLSEFREIVGSTILSQAEKVIAKRANTKKSFELSGLLFRERQEELLKRVFLMYEILSQKVKFKLKYRHAENDKPFFNLATIRLIRDSYNIWFQRNREQLKKDEETLALLALDEVDQFLINTTKVSQPEISFRVSEEYKSRQREREFTRLISDFDTLGDFERAQSNPQEVKQIVDQIDVSIKNKSEELSAILATVKGRSVGEAGSLIQKMISLSHQIKLLFSEKEEWLSEQTWKKGKEQPTSVEEKMRNAAEAAYEISRKRLDLERILREKALKDDERISSKEAIIMQKELDQIIGKIEAIDFILSGLRGKTEI